MTNPGAIYLSPVERDPIKQNSAIRQLIENLGTAAVTATNPINAGTYGASGSNQSTTGSITAGAKTLFLAAPIDFQPGQYVRVNQAGATFVLNAPTALGVVVNGLTGTTHYSYQVASLDANGGVGVAIAAVTVTNGNAALTVGNNNTVSWTGASGGAEAYAVYGSRNLGAMHLVAIVRGATSWTDFGANQDFTAPDFIPSAPLVAAQNDWLISKISSSAPSGTVQLADVATNTVTGVAVNHDDTTAIINAIAALPAFGGEIDLNPGDYLTTGTINIGNGNSSTDTASTVNGIRLRGLSARPGLNNEISGVRGGARIHYQAYAVALSINGPLVGWGLENIYIDFVAPATTNIGIVQDTASFGQCNGVVVSGAQQIDWFIRAPGHNSAAYNSYNDIEIFMGPWLFKDGIRISGGAASANLVDEYSDVWKNLLIIPSASALGQQTAIHLGETDSLLFEAVQVNPVTPAITAINFDYSTNTNGWPSATFIKFDPYNNAIVNTGSPPSQQSQPANKFIDFATGNGALYPFIKGVQVVELARAPKMSVAAGSFFVQQIPAATADLTGQLAYIIDGAAAPAWGSVMAGGGTLPTLVWCNGTHWTVVGAST